MLSCEDVWTWLDQLCDLTRRMDAVDRIREANDLLDEVEPGPRQFLMQWRAAAAADLHYLEGVRLRQIATLVERSVQGVSQWLQTYGPTHYLTLADDGAGDIRTDTIVVQGEDARAKIQKARAAGWIVVPAVENAYEPTTGAARAGVDLHELWSRLDRDS